MLDRFEQQIDSLLDRYEQFKEENSMLREKQALLLNENAMLCKKHELAVSTIEKIIERLKLIEKEDVTGT